MKQAIALLVVLTAVSCSSGISHIASSQEALVNRIKFSTLKVGNEKGHGSGFYVKLLGKDLAITNDHVCEIFKDGSPGYLETYNHTQITDFKILQSDGRVDLCALEFKPPYEMLPLSLAVKTMPYEEVMAMGYPVMNPLMPTFGYLGDIEPDQLHQKNTVQFLSAQIFPGNSGSAVVDMNGDLVGVVSEGDSYTNRGMIVTHFHLVQFLMGLI